MEPFVSAGLVFEYLNHPSWYRGGGVSLGYGPGTWSVNLRYRADMYRMSYFGTTSETASVLVSGGNLSSALLDRVDVIELRQDLLFDVGFQVWDRLELSPGIRWIRFDNSFSAFTFLGPALGGEWTMPWRAHRIVLGLDWAANPFGRVSNYGDEFVVFDGRETISYYGEPRYLVDWRALFASRPFHWAGIAVGYEGSITLFQGNLRYSHGVTLGAEF